jgi:hypothetical protein
MKKVILSIVWPLVTSVVLAQPGSILKSEVKFKDAKIEVAYRNYLELKNALVASKTDAAKQAAVNLKTSLASVKESKNAINEAAKISTAATIDDIRKSFASLSTDMTRIVKAGQLEKGTLYLEYCPMANNNTGAYWLSNDKEIRNPYFGDKMLKCGSVKETIH